MIGHHHNHNGDPMLAIVFLAAAVTLLLIFSLVTPRDGVAISWKKKTKTEKKGETKCQ